MKILAISLVIIAMLLSGCIGYSEPEVPPAPVPETPTPTPEAPVPEQPAGTPKQTEVEIGRASCRERV